MNMPAGSTPSAAAHINQPYGGGGGGGFVKSSHSPPMTSVTPPTNATQDTVPIRSAATDLFDDDDDFDWSKIM